MAFNRVVEFSIGSNGFGTLVSTLDIEFEITRSRTLSENSAKFRIYNANENTRKNILVKDQTVVFKAGYEDEGEGAGTIFIGQVQSASSVNIDSTWVTELLCVSARGQTVPLQLISVSASYGPRTYINTILKEIADTLGLILTGKENSTDVILPNGWVYAGTSRGALRNLRKILESHDLALFIDNGEIAVYSVSESTEVSVGYITPTSGLLSITDVTEQLKPEQEKKAKKKGEKIPKRRVSMSTLLISRFKPNSVVVVQETGPLDGVYMIEKISFIGDNFGGRSFNCNIEASV